MQIIELPIEIWRDVNGFEGYYQVSNLGRVKSLSRIIKTTRGNLTVNEKMLNGHHATKGYVQVELKKDGKRTLKMLHRLVAEAFLEPIEGKTQINHRDGDKDNNSALNLEWMTCRENIKHAWDNGLQHSFKGEANWNHILTDDAVRFIRKNYKPWDREFGASALGRKFGVTSTPIILAAKRKSWRHVS